MYYIHRLIYDFEQCVLNVRCRDETGQLHTFIYPYWLYVKLRNLTDIQVKLIAIRLADKLLNYDTVQECNLFGQYDLELNTHPRDTIHRFFLTAPLTKHDLYFLRHSKYEKIEFNLTNDPIKFQKDTGLYLHNWYDFEVSDDYLISYTRHEDVDIEPTYHLVCYDIEIFSAIDGHYNKDMTDTIATISIITYLSTDLNTRQRVFLGFHKDIEGMCRIDREDDIDILFFQSEQTMLEYFVANYLHDDTYDIIYGYNNIAFDDAYITAKCAYYGISLSPKLEVFDLLLNIRSNNTIKFDNLKLKTVCKTLFSARSGDPNMNQKYDLSYVQMNQLFRSFFTEPFEFDRLSRVVVYNLQDVHITIEVNHHPTIDGISQTLTHARLTGCPVRQIVMNNSSILLPYIYRAIGTQWYIYNTLEIKRGEGFEGGFVEFKPENGCFYRNVYPFDFNSLYPNVIRLYNLSPDTQQYEGGDTSKVTTFEFYCKEQAKQITTHWVKPELYEGIIPRLQRELLQARNRYKKLFKTTGNRKYDNLQRTVKLIMNSIYGKFGEAKSVQNTFKLGNKDVGQSTTYGGRTNIKLLQRVLTGEVITNELSLEPYKETALTRTLKRSQFVYTDTDSVYISLPSDLELDGSDIEEYINGIFKAPLRVEYEGHISHMNICKKKYYLMRQYNPKTNSYLVKTKGVKEDIPRMNIEFHRRIFDLFCAGNDITNELLFAEMQTFLDVLQVNQRDGHYGLFQFKLSISKDSLTANDAKVGQRRLEKYLKPSKMTPETTLSVQEVLDRIRDELDVEEEDTLKYMGCGKTIYLGHLYYKEGVSLPKNRVYCVKMTNYYKEPLLNSIAVLNKLPVDMMITGRGQVDMAYYYKSLNNYIANSIHLPYKDFFKKQPKMKF